MRPLFKEAHHKPSSISPVRAIKAIIFDLRRGMPADIFIETGQRTFFTYLTRPVVDSFSRH
jgi:hypothetical protein